MMKFINFPLIILRVSGKKEGQRINWINPYTKIKDVTWSNNNVDIKWFYDGTLNASYNCIDRHLLDKPDKVAIIWEGDDPNDSLKLPTKNFIKKYLNLQIC